MPPEPLTLDQILARLQTLANPANIAGMERYGIHAAHALGISMPELRALAKGQRSHALALQLWETGIHEARILASLVDDPGQVTPRQMEAWARDFNSWDMVDQVCLNLFSKTPYAHATAQAWVRRDEEFVKRAGFSLMAVLAVHDKSATDEQMDAFYPAITAGAGDPRNFVRKAVNWALRQIGKRNRALNASALALAREIERSGSKSARWVARDAIRELTAEKTLSRLKG